MAPPGLTSDESAPKRKKVVVVGLGMVGIAFVEKLITKDKRRGEYEIVVLGEEKHVAYNRVGLTSFFSHRSIPDLYLNPLDWYTSHEPGLLGYHINTLVTEIDTKNRVVFTKSGDCVTYDILVLATGSDALLPRHTPGHDAKGVFVYRTIEDLEKMIEYSQGVDVPDGVTKRAAVVGGGLLGLEAAHAVQGLESFPEVALIERNRWVLSRQLDGEAGGMVVEKVRGMGVDVMLSKRVGKINVDPSTGRMTQIIFEDGQIMDCQVLCFAIGIRARDDIARAAGIKCHHRGGIIIDNGCETSVPGVYAIGECANWGEQTYGLIAPGIEMADVLSFNLTQGKDHKMREFKTPDLSTKLKLMGVDVASFGDYFADRDGPKAIPMKHGKRPSLSIRRGSAAMITGEVDKLPVKALQYKDPFSSVYKKYIFTTDGKYLLGGMIIGDTADYIKLVSLVKAGKPLEIPPSQLILGAKKEGDDDAADLDDDAQICSCHNVTKGMVAGCIKEDGYKSIGEVKAKTKAGTGCGGCMPLVQSIFNAEMKAAGNEISNALCPHFTYSRADLYNIIKVKQLKSLQEVMKEAGKNPDSLGCEVCKPVMASIFSSLWNPHVMDALVHGLQDTNDRFLGNIQRNGTFSVIPRVSGGEITPDKLVVIGTVAQKYDLYTKITGGQRIDLFGAKKGDLPEIWEQLIEGGMESGHAYGKSLRTVKSCVGSTWCRFGIGDSVGLAVRLEERYKSIRAPHKIKGGVSGCIRECAEAQSKDFGLIATDKGFNIYVGGNGGSKPKHSELLIADCPPDEVVPILDRYLMFYIRTGDRLQRTARWLENMEGGMKYLRQVILEDKLGICADLEKQMGELVGTWYDEWEVAVKDPVKRAQFKQFQNTEERSEQIELVRERDQTRPANWPKQSALEDFRGYKWTSMEWEKVCKVSDLRHSAAGGSCAVKRGDTQLAIFYVEGKGYFATQQMCPHKRAFVLSDGIIGDDPASSAPFVSCPMHKRNYNLSADKDVGGGKCLNDETVSIATFPVEARGEEIWLKLPPEEELDSLLGTKKWRVKKNETPDKLASLDKFTAKTKIKFSNVAEAGCGETKLDW